MCKTNRIYTSLQTEAIWHQKKISPNLFKLCFVCMAEIKSAALAVFYSLSMMLQWRSGCKMTLYWSATYLTHLAYQETHNWAAFNSSLQIIPVNVKLYLVWLWDVFSLVDNEEEKGERSCVRLQYLQMHVVRVGSGM